MKRKMLSIEWRKAANKKEKDSYGVTTFCGDTASVFMNSKNTKSEDIDTFFHEMAHVFFNFYNSSLPTEREEIYAEKIGRICAEVLRHAR